MKKVYVLYIFSSEIELVFAFLQLEDAKKAAEPWGKYATIIPLTIQVEADAKG